MIVNSFPVITETFILNQITGLLKRGINVDIYSFYKNDNSIQHHAQIDKYRLSEKNICLDSVPESKIARIRNIVRYLVRYRSIAMLMKMVRTCNFVRYGKPAATLYLANILYLLRDAPGYDIIHCQFGALAPDVLRLMEIGILQGKLVTSFRGYDATVYIRKNKGIYKELFEKGNLFLPVSNSIRSILIKRGCNENKIKVLHSGINSKDFNDVINIPQSGDVIQIATIGRLTEKKGIIYGIRAIQKVLGAGYRVCYNIVGDGNLRTDLENFINKHELNGNVILDGWKTQDELVIFLREKIHILIAPSITTEEGDQEGIPNVLKEAMAAGKPVVATNHSGIPELVENGISGFIVPERDVDALAKKIMYLIDHPEKWAILGHAGRLKVENEFDIEKLNDRLVSYYKNLLSV